MNKGINSQLFWSFLRIGLFTFGGGYAMIPLIQREVVDAKSWVERDNFLKLLTLAQSAPGPISLNAAVFVGYKVNGNKGALAAISGVVLPSFVIILLVAMFFAEIKDNHFVEAAFKGMRPAVVALIAAPIFGMAKGLRLEKLAVVALTAIIVWYFGISPVYCIILGCCGGISFMMWKNRKKFEQ